MFWHTPRPDADVASYEAAQLAFHAALAADPPDGFSASWILRTGQLPWLRAPSDPGYEDWYLVDGFAALDRLNDAAVSGGRRGPHDRAAAASASGAAGLYRPWPGASVPDQGPDVVTPPVGRPVVSHWLAKPAAYSYEAWRDELLARLPVHARTWQRQMVLGPTPEFCVQLGRAGALPWDTIEIVGTRLA